MIKICSPQLGISPLSVLGGEIYDYQTIKGFSQKGFKTFVYLPKNRYFDKKLKNVIVDFCFMTHIVPPWIYSFLMLPYLFKTYKDQKFDILRIHSPRFLGLGAMIFKLVHPQVPILTSAVTVDSEKIYYPIERWVYQRSSAIIVQSQYMKKTLVNKYKLTDPQKIYVTFGGQNDNFSLKIKKPIEAKLIKEDEFLLVFMGALIKRKNPQFALKVFIKLQSVIPNCKLVFIGNGEEKGDLIRKTKESCLTDKVIFISKAVGAEKSYWFSRMDIFLAPSLDEGFGLVVTEAMSFKKVVLTSNKAAFPEIIQNGVDGYCLELNLVTWVKAIKEVLNNKKMAGKIATAARIKVKQQFNWQRTYNLNAKVIKNLV